MKHRLLFAAALLGAAANADDRLAWSQDGLTEFALRIGHHKADLDYGGSMVETSFDRVTAIFAERFSDQLQLSLIAGYTTLTQTNNAATSGRELNGYHVGIGFDLDLWRRDRADVFVDGHWIYQKLDHEHVGQEVELVTYEPNVRLGAGLTLSPVARLYGGVRYGAIDGEQRQTGITNETRKVKSDREAGGFAGLELKLEDGGYIRVAAESGSDRNVAVYFGKRY